MIDRCLSYFRDAVAARAGSPSWEQWWRANESVVQKCFGPTDYERLRKRGIVAARMIVRRTTLPWSSRVSVSPAFGSPAISEDNVAAFERDHGLSLPADYREFLLSYNGGRPRPGWLRISAPQPSEQQIAGFSHLLFEPNLPEPRCTHMLQFAAPPPAEYFPIAQLASGDDEMLFLKVTGENTGSIACRQGDAAPREVATSFDELMNRLDYPERAKPWMGLIDSADVDGFRKWLESVTDLNRATRPPVSRRSSAPPGVTIRTSRSATCMRPTSGCGGLVWRSSRRYSREEPSPVGQCVTHSSPATRRS